MTRSQVFAPAVVAVAALVACVAALLASSGEAAASFPGENGRIAFTAQSCDYESGAGCDDPEIATVSPTGGIRKQVTNNAVEDEYPAFSPDGQRIAFQTRRFGDYEIYTMRPSGKVVTAVTKNTQSDDLQPAYSPGGRRIAYSGDDGDLYVVNIDGTGVRKILDTRIGKMSAETPAWSPDGTKICFYGVTFDAAGDGSGDIWTMDADGTDAKRLTTDPQNDYAPAWSPDGTKIAFTSGRDEPGEQYSDSDIYVINADGSGERDLTRTADQNEYEPTWSPDGNKIAFAAFRYPDQDIYKIGVDGTGRKNLDAPMCQPDWR